MVTAFEWQIPDPQPEGTVSLVVRMTLDEAAALALIDLSSATQPDAATSRSLARPIVQVLQDAIAQGALVLP
ncbi:MAG: hypothetical protein ACK5SP_00640 [bacterium]